MTNWQNLVALDCWLNFTHVEESQGWEKFVVTLRINLSLEKGDYINAHMPSDTSHYYGDLIQFLNDEDDVWDVDEHGNRKYHGLRAWFTLDPSPLYDSTIRRLLGPVAYDKLIKAVEASKETRSPWKGSISLDADHAQSILDRFAREI